jgi:hypothetical protein
MALRPAFNQPRHHPVASPREGEPYQKKGLCRFANPSLLSRLAGFRQGHAKQVLRVIADRGTVGHFVLQVATDRQDVSQQPLATPGRLIATGGLRGGWGRDDWGGEGTPLMIAEKFTLWPIGDNPILCIRCLAIRPSP